VPTFQGCGDFADGGLAKKWFLRQDIYRFSSCNFIFYLLIDPINGFRIHSIGQCCQNGAALTFEKLAYHPNRLDDFVGSLCLSINHRQNRASQIIGHPGIEVELEGGRHPRIIRTFAEHKFRSAFQCFVFIENIFYNDIISPLGNQVLSILVFVGVHVFIRHLQVVAGPDQLDVVIAFHIGNNRPEESDVVQTSGQQFHDTKGHH